MHRARSGFHEGRMLNSAPAIGAQTGAHINEHKFTLSGVYRSSCLVSTVVFFSGGKQSC